MELPVMGIRRLRMATDGDGVRTLVGLSGCPLNCRYCLNPDARNGSCYAEPLTAEALLERVRVDNLYFLATGGGVTFGGGEPLLYTREIASFAALCPEQWSLWAETALNVPEEQVRLAAQVFDHFLVDIKSADPEIYAGYTGGRLAPALENLRLLLELVGAERITVRLPLIPEYADEASREASRKTLEAMGIRDFDYLTYITE